MSEFFINARFLTQKITGVQRFALEVCLELKKIEPNIRFVAPKNIIHHDVARKLGVEQIGYLNGHLWEQIELPLFLEAKGRPLLLNLCNTAPLFYKNQVVTLYDLAFYHYPNWFSYLFSTYYQFLIPKILKTSRHVITDSMFIKKDILNVYGTLSKDISVIYGAPAKVFSERTRVLKQTKPYILAVGSLDPRKNLMKLIMAFNILNINNLDLWIVGQKNRVFVDHSIEEQSNKNANIKFTGYVSDDELADIYANAILFVYPSLYEGFGIPPLEAQACGCPVLVSNVASLPEVCGASTLYCDPSNLEDIVEKLSLLEKDKSLQSSLREKGYLNIKRFSWKASAKSLLNVINGVK